MESLEALRYTRGSLELLDQRKLPTVTTYVTVSTLQECHAAIKDMVVRGAPAIAIAAALALANDVQRITHDSGQAALEYVVQSADYLTSRCVF